MLWPISISFAEMFEGGARSGEHAGSRVPGEDLEAEVELTLREVLTGVTERINCGNRPLSDLPRTGTLRGRTCPTLL